MNYLQETNATDTQILDLQTPIKKLKFELNDLNSNILTIIESNTSIINENFQNLDKLSNELSINKSFNYLNNSYNRINNEILNPFNQCNEILIAINNINKTNKNLRNLSYLINILSKIESIDKSEKSLSSKPFKNLLNLSKLINEFENNIKLDKNLLKINIINQYNEYINRMLKNCQLIINNNINNILKFNDNNSDNDKSILNLVNSSKILNESNFDQLIKQIFNSCLNYSINSIIRNLNNSKNLTKFISSLIKPVMLLITINEISNSNSKLDEIYWKELSISINNGLREVISRGGPVLKNLVIIREDIISSINKLFEKVYQHENIRKTKNIQLQMMINSLSNFQKR
ncbi:Golgi transport complex subunit [Pichia kluyveri]|uniref:Golgi transport complex subunit n=1 Tax=Pichia kluyveri TaxID=36015 RepID=A0AAV5RC10_PICKL|nr:Golgi transport complex subunit [Pichia kluyveri]